MKLVLDIIYSFATGTAVRRIAQAVYRGGAVVNTDVKAFIACLLPELWGKGKTVRGKLA